jgi:hypothetical protein
MIWGIIIAIVVVFIGSSLIGNSKDSQDLAGRKLEEKFNVIINSINNVAFNNEGVIKEYDNKHIYLIHPISGNQMIEFLYSQGVLAITWKYKYFQKELIHKRSFLNVRNISLFEQEKIARAFISEMEEKIDNHKNLVMRDF